MRALATSLLACGLMTGLGSCAPKAGYESPITDQRFDLMAVAMPPLLKTDAEKCVKTLNLTRSAAVDFEGDVEAMYELVLNFWQAVDEKLLSKGGVADVLPSGGDPSEVESILPAGLKLPTAVGHACGEYGGRLAVTMGLMSLEDSVKVTLAEDPELFEKLGTSAEAVKAGLSVISAQAEGLKVLSTKEKVSCVAIYQSAAVSTPSIKPLLNVWMTTLVDEIESGRLDASKIRGQSKYWTLLASEGPDAVLSADGYKDAATKCDGWINAAIAEQAAAQ